jgi:hypothetical protein
MTPSLPSITSRTHDDIRGKSRAAVHPGGGPIKKQKTPAP